MTINFTHFKVRFDNTDLNKTNLQLKGENFDESEPSKSVIRNLLNYSKALSVIPESNSDKVHLVLLN
jgi:hypothetical protein